MSTSDKLTYDLSTEIEGTETIFTRKDWLSIVDQQNQGYGNNQSVIDTSQLSNSNKWMNYREAYLEVPMLLTLTSGAAGAATNGALAPAAAATSADYAVGLKNWFGSIVHSMQVEYNGAAVVQQTPFINMWNSFKLMTTLSWGDVANMGATIGFYPDDSRSFSFQGAASLSGVGTCNNTDAIPAATPSGTVTAGAFNSYNSRNGNLGYLKRQQFINFDPAGDIDGAGGALTYASLITEESVGQIWKSYVSTRINGVNAGVAGVWQCSITGIVYLRHLSDFFDKVPLFKAAFIRIIMNLNNTSVSFATAAGGEMSLTSVSNSVGGVCPLMISSRIALNGGEGLGVNNANYVVSLSVGSTCLNQSQASTPGVDQGKVAKSIFLYVPAYTFTPAYEMAYLSSGIKTIEYTDVYQYPVYEVGTGNFQNLISNGIANLKTVLILPFYSKSSNGLGGSTPTYQSPFDPAGCGPTSPLCLLSQFNVLISGQNVLYNTQRYSYEQFTQNVLGCRSVNAALTDGVTAGLISQLDFELEYCYYVVDVSRMEPDNRGVPKSIQIQGLSKSAKNIDLWTFAEYGNSIKIDVLTGARIQD